MKTNRQDKTEIRNVLRETGEVIGKLQGELTKLTLYFSNIKAVLELLRKNECQRFTREIRYALNEATPQKGVAFDEIQAQVSCP